MYLIAAVTSDLSIAHLNSLCSQSLRLHALLGISIWIDDRI